MIPINQWMCFFFPRFSRDKPINPICYVPQNDLHLDFLRISNALYSLRTHPIPMQPLLIICKWVKVHYCQDDMFITAILATYLQGGPLRHRFCGATN